MFLEFFLYTLHPLLTIVPFAILRYYPFLHQLRIKTFFFWVIFGCIASFESVWFAYIQVHGQMLGITHAEFVRFGFYFVYLILSCAIIKEKPSKHLFVWLLIMIFSSALTALSWFIDRLFVNFPAYFISTIILFILLPVFMLWGFRFLNRIVIPLLHYSSYYSSRLITIILTIVFIMGLLIAGELPTQTTYPLIRLGTRLLVSIAAIIICFIFKSILDEQRRIFALQEEICHQEALLTLSHQQFLALSEKISETKRIRHDLKHHLAAMQNYLAEKNYEKLSEYLSYSEHILPPNTVLSFCDHHATNIILSYYYDKARAYGIPIEIYANLPKELSLAEGNLWVLLGNLLENALEASLRITDDKKFIKVKIQLKGHSLGIAIDNLCNTSTLHQTTSGFQSSKDKPDCGIGLTSISLLASKHNGLATFREDNGWFLASVHLSL